MSNEMIKNDRIGKMKKEMQDSNPFEGVAIMKDEEDAHTLIYHEACDTDLWHFTTDDVDFSEVMELVLIHLGECEPKEDDNDPWEDLLDDEEIEPL